MNVFSWMIDLHNSIKSKDMRSLRDTNNGGQRAYSEVLWDMLTGNCLTLSALPQGQKILLKITKKIYSTLIKLKMIKHLYFQEKCACRSTEGICCILKLIWNIWVNYCLTWQVIPIPAYNVFLLAELRRDYVKEYILFISLG